MMNPTQKKSIAHPYLAGRQGPQAVALLWAIPLALLLGAAAARAQNTTAPPSLKTLSVPGPAALGSFVKDKGSAILLGKALFWDMQVGSDGTQACATCHFHAGADSRTKNTVNPGQNASDVSFQVVPGPNGTVTPANFPLHKVADRDDRLSTVLQDLNDVLGSQGVFDGEFLGVLKNQAAELSNPVPDPIFHVGTHNTRRVTGRNAPSVINAAFNYNNFWDGRANNTFNGVDPFGDADLNARVFTNDGTGTLTPMAVHLENSSLASQAVGPPGSDVEMSLTHRTFPDIGKKLLTLRPLGKQLVHGADSVMGSVARRSKRSVRPGIQVTYKDLIRAAFNDQFWNVTDTVVSVDSTGSHLVPKHGRLAANQYSQMQANFSLFFGLAIQMYEQTLISDDSPFDRFQEGDTTAMSRTAQDGMNLFFTPADQGFAGGSCFNCHMGPEFTKATVSNVGAVIFDDLPEQIIERMDMNDGHGASYDSGYYNIGVRPTEEDKGRGGSDPFGFPLSFTARALMIQNGTTLPFSNPPNICADGKTQPCPISRIAIDGTFKTPSLRNVELTGPYFHNGGQATLMQVVDFYTRGGDFHEHNIDNLDPDVDLIDGMNEVAKQHIVDFLLSLTDDRVRWEKGPFDHPELFVPNGSPGDSASVQCPGSSTSTCNELFRLAPVGASGRAAEGLPPLGTFLDLDPHSH
jgi:cytochrome c peroxidase